MNNRTKDLIVKFLLLLSLSLWMLMILSPFVSDLLFEFTVSKDLMEFLLIAVLCISCFTVVLFNVWGLSQKKAKTKKLNIEFKNYEDMKVLIIPILLKKGYKKIGEIALDSESEMLIFAQKFLFKCKCFLIVKSNEFTEEVRIDVDKEFKNTLYDCYGKNFFTNKLYLTSLVCVNRVSPLFYNFINGYNVNSLKEFYYNVGLSFGGKTLYLPLINDGLSINKSKKMSSEFYEIIREACKTGDGSENTGDG